MISERVTKPTLVGGDSMALFVIKQLLAGLKVNLTIDGQVHEGWVHNLDYACGPELGMQPSYVFAMVRVPDLQGDSDYFPSVKVAISTDGTVSVMPDTEPVDNAPDRQE